MTVVVDALRPICLASSTSFHITAKVRTPRVRLFVELLYCNKITTKYTTTLNNVVWLSTCCGLLVMLQVNCIIKSLAIGNSLYKFASDEIYKY